MITTESSSGVKGEGSMQIVWAAISLEPWDHCSNIVLVLRSTKQLQATIQSDSDEYI